MYCWGENCVNGDDAAGCYYLLGDGSISKFSSTPVRVSGSDWQDISVSASYSCAIKKSGALLCWGNGSDGGFGIGWPAAVGFVSSPVGVNDVSSSGTSDAVLKIGFFFALLALYSRIFIRTSFNQTARIKDRRIKWYSNFMNVFSYLLAIIYCVTFASMNVFWGVEQAAKSIYAAALMPMLGVALIIIAINLLQKGLRSVIFSTALALASGALILAGFNL
jgi:hypothetical protein